MEFSSGQLFLFALRGIFTAALPFAVYGYLKHRHGGRPLPVFTGICTVLLILVPRSCSGTC